MAKGIFPLGHWNDVLAHVASHQELEVEIEITQYSVIIDHTMVSFITDATEDVGFVVSREALLKTNSTSLVTIEFSKNSIQLFIYDDEGSHWAIAAIAG